MKRIAIALAVSALSLGSAGSVLAGNPHGPNASQQCREVEDQIFPGDWSNTHGGCTSTLAHGGETLSKAAYVGQCMNIRENDPDSFYGEVILEPTEETGYGFGGTISSCSSLLEHFHTSFGG